MTDLSFHPDSRRLVSVDSEGEAILWDVRSGALEFEMNDAGGGVRSARFSPDGEYLLTGAEDGGIAVRVARTGEAIRCLEGHRASVMWLCWNQSGTLLASSSSDGAILLWRGLHGPPVAELTGHHLFARLAFSPDGRWLASGGSGKLLRVWDLATYECARTLNPLNGPPFACFISCLTDGWWSAAGGGGDVWGPGAGNVRADVGTWCRRIRVEC